MAVQLGVSSGFVTVAPTVDPEGGATTTIDGFSVVTKHTSPSGATKITEVGYWWNPGAASSTFRIGLYAADGATVPGEAGTRLYVANVVSGLGGGWKVITVDWDISGNTDYWLAAQMNSHVGSSTIDREDTGGAGIDSKTNINSLDDPYGGGALSDSDGMFAIYALVAIEGGDPIIGPFPTHFNP